MNVCFGVCRTSKKKKRKKNKNQTYLDVQMSDSTLMQKIEGMQQLAGESNDMRLGKRIVLVQHSLQFTTGSEFEHQNELGAGLEQLQQTNDVRLVRTE